MAVAFRETQKRVSLETAEEPDSLRSGAAPPQTSVEKGGNYSVCFRVGYFFVDAKFGEDYLTGETSSAVGQEPARYMLAALLDPAGNLIYLGYLPPDGCTGSINHPSGTYTALLTTSLYRAGTDVGIDITSDDTRVCPYFLGLSYACPCPYANSGNGSPA